MTDPLKIDGLINRLKSRFIKDSYGQSASWQTVKRKREEDTGWKDDNTDSILEDPENEKFFKLGQALGLKKNEIIEAMELLQDATSQYPDNADAASLVLQNERIKYPVVEKFIDDIPENLLEELKDKYPDLYMAIKNPFEFICKYPDTLSEEMFRKLSYTELLDFSRRCPEHYNRLSEARKQKDENDAT
jgi:hypothetical protein